jgi:hypothetical protein
LQAEADSEDRNTAGNRVVQRSREVAFAQSGDECGKMSNAGEDQRSGCRDFPWTGDTFRFGTEAAERAFD